MKYGIEYILEKRGEDILNDHMSDDAKSCDNGELLKAAMCLISGESDKWPKSWDSEILDEHVKSGHVKLLAAAGAYLAAEIDRVSSDKNKGYYLGRDMDVSYSGIVGEIQEDHAVGKEMLLHLIQVDIYNKYLVSKYESMSDHLNYNKAHVKQGIYNICNHLKITTPFIIIDGSKCYEIDEDFGITEKKNIF